MNYELALKLQKAGFPKKTMEYTICDRCGLPNPPIKNSGYPTLEELIKACGGSVLLSTGGNCVVFWYEDPLGWGLEVEKSKYMKTGSTPEEAVAMLWLALQDK